MVAPVDLATLEAVGGQKTARAAQGFADTMMNLYKMKKAGEVQDMQMNQIKQQQEEWAANKEVRGQERKLNLANLGSQLEQLPVTQANEARSNLNESMQLHDQAYDLALSDLGTVRGAKGYRKWKGQHKDLLQKNFDSDDEFQEFMKEPFTVEGKDQMLRYWRSNKPEMIDKELEYNMQSNLAAAKDKATAEQHSMPSIVDLTNILADRGVDADIRGEGAQVARDLIDMSKNRGFPMRISGPMATRLVEMWAEEVDTDWGQTPSGSILQKQQQFVQDLANGKADYYVSAVYNIPMDKINQMREQNPDYSTAELYEALEGQIRSGKR